MAYRSECTSHPGLARDLNEDALIADDRAGIWLVADGMGGHAGGDVASRLAVENIHRQLSAGVSLRTAIEQAHLAILDRTRIEPELNGMGTTIVAAQARGRRLELAWVGDSRIYRIVSGQPQQLSVDHSFVQDMVARGVLTEDEAREHPEKNVVRQALGQTGPQRLQVDTLLVTLKAGQRILLCTDGVHDMLEPQVLEQALAQGSAARTVCALEDAVLSTSASDNFSIVVVERTKGRLHGWASVLRNGCCRPRGGDRDKRPAARGDSATGFRLAQDR